MPSTVVSQSDWTEHFSHFLQKYKDDLPDPDCLECEMRMWKLHFLDLKDPPPTTLQEVLLHADPLSFPNILTVFRIFGMIPVTTCTCERSISTLRRLKTYMRSTMGETRLQALTLLNVQCEIKLDVERVIVG